MIAAFPVSKGQHACSVTISNRQKGALCAQEANCSVHAEHRQTISCSFLQLPEGAFSELTMLLPISRIIIT